MVDPDLQAVFVALQADGDPAHALLCVGGCVRDVLMDRPVVDVDLATIHPPDVTLARLNAAGIDVLEIGIEHGTVVARFEQKLFQITTLRVDVETDGRHATVAYTDDWAADASRRDFTINALYADLDGHVFDPLGGMADVEGRRVRFIGDANARIEEDALRILRFFRFHAQFDSAAFDPDGLAACRAHFDMFANLSGERIRDELFKILLSPATGWMLNHMEYLDFFLELFPADERPELAFSLAFIGARERALDEADPLRRLAMLLPDPEGAASAAARLHLSNAATARLTTMASIPPGMTPKLYPHTRKLRLYDLGADAWRDAVILSWARAEARAAEFAEVDVADDSDWLELLRFPETWSPPIFPLQGADVLAFGVPQGPEIGRHLAAVENWWMIRDFKPDHSACVAKLKRRLLWVGLRRRVGLG